MTKRRMVHIPFSIVSSSINDTDDGAKAFNTYTVSTRIHVLPLRSLSVNVLYN